MKTKTNNSKKMVISVTQEDVQNIIDCYEKDIEYIKRLEGNWKELKESIILQRQDNRISMINIGGISGSMLSRENDALRDILDKMQELEKESDVK